MSEPWEQYLRPSELQPSAVKKSGMDQYLDQLDRADAAVIKRLPPPDHVGRSNEMARTFKLPPTIADSALPDLEKQHAINRAQEVAKQYPAVGRWASDPRNAAVAADDYDALGKLGKSFSERIRKTKSDFLTGGGFFDRMGDLLNRAVFSMDEGAASLRGALQKWSADNPLPWTSEENLQKANKQAAEARALARIYGDVASTSVANETTWQDVKKNPFNVGGFVLDQGVGSIPGMAQAAFALPLYVAGQAGSIGRNRAQNDGRQDAEAGDVVAAAPAAVVSAALERLGIQSIFRASGKKAVTRILQAAGGEGATEFLQSGVEYAGGTIGTETGFDPAQAFDQSLAGAVAGVGMGGGLRGAGEVSTAAVRPVINRFVQADQALKDAAVLDNVMDAAAKSKTAGRDNVAFADLLREMADESGAENVYVPAEAINAYMQSDGYDGSFDGYRDAIDEGLATGGDVVIPIAEAATRLAGKPAWAALKDDVRLTPGGMTPREAQTFDEAMADVMAEISDKFSEQDAQAKKDMEPRDKLMQSVADKLMNAGFTPATARTQAELLTQRAATRTARMGQDLTGNEYNDLVIQQVLPEGLAQAQKADALDMTIGVMRTGKTGGSNRGPSLVDFIRSKGGIEDRGGDLKSMGIGPIKGVSRKGQLKLLRDYNPDQASMIGDDGQQNSNSPDELALRAWEAGYFPEFTERPSVNDLLDALGESVAGRDRFAQAADAQAEGLRKAAEELRALLENRGIDPDKASAKEIRSAVDVYVSEQSQGQGYDQLADTIDIDGVQRPTRNSNGQPLAQTEEGVRAFWNWFGESKVVDEEGRPLVVYHGTGADIEAFNGITWASVGTDLANEYASMREVLGQGVATVLPLYVRAERIFDADDGLSKSETVGSFFNNALEQSIEQGREIDLERARALLDTIRAAGKREESGPRYDRHDFWNKSAEMFGRDGAEAIRDMFDLMGFDGIKMRENGSDTFGSFNPTQIKSVNNRGIFDPADPRILYQVSPDQARELSTPVELPDDPLFLEAVANTKGAEVTLDGLLIDLVRVQKPDQEGAQSIRTGVFYLPKGSPNLRHYKASGSAYGGSEKFEGKTLLRKPLFVKGATGGKAPEAAYDAIKGKGAIKNLERDVMSTVTSRAALNREVGLFEENVQNFLEANGVDGWRAYDIIRNSQKGNTLRYALQEIVIAHAVRDAGYDSVLGYSKGKAGAAISEVFDVREQSYPARGMDSEVHEAYFQSFNDGPRGRIVFPGQGYGQGKTVIEMFQAIAAYTDEQAQGVGYDQVDVNSEAFTKWFGDSKVVDAQGKPLVVYHGTGVGAEGDFAFDPRRISSNGSAEGYGFYFTTDRATAEGYTGRDGGSLVQAFVSMQNPMPVGQRAFPTKQVEKIINLMVDAEIALGDVDDYKDTFISNYVDTYSVSRASAVREVARILVDSNDTAIDQIAELGNSAGSKMAAHEAVRDVTGFDGIVSDGYGGRGEAGGTIYVAWFPTQIKSVNNRGTFNPADPRILYQSFSDGPRGRIVFPGQGFGQGKTVIEMFQSRDSSTFLHEVGHLWLEELRFDASDPNAPEQLKADWQAVQDWFKANGHPLTDGVIPVEAHEMWARGVERYLMEGRAPSPALRSLFQTFKSWLVQVYRTVAKLNSPITDDIRAVMDRLIATDEEIAQATEEQHLEAAFTEKPSTMTEGEWTDYQSITTEAKATAQDTLLAKVMSQVKRRVTKEYQDRKAAIRAEVTEEIDARPEFRALRQLRATPVDAQWLKDGYGEDALALFPKSVPPLYKDGGANADDIAELTGFKSGDEMVRLLFGVEAQRLQLREGGDKRSVREVMIAQETETRLTEQYGDPFTDGSIEEEALAAVHNEKQGEVLAAELRVLSRASGDRPTPYRIAKAWAARTVREGIVRDVVSRSAIERYRRAAQKAGKASVDAILAGDGVEAFRQKQAQMLNNALVSEAQKVADEVETAQARLEKIARKKTIKSVDQDYLERAQALMEQVELRPRSQKSIDRQAQFEAWANEQQANGADIVVPASFAASLGTTHWSRLPVEQFLGLDAAVAQIIHLGRFKQKLLDNKEARDFDEVRSEALGQMGGMGKRPPSDLMEPSRWDGIRERIAGADAALLKMETVFDWLDQGKSDGVFNRIVFQPIAEAQHNEQAMLREYVLKVQELTKALPKQTVKRWRDKFTDPRLMNRKTGNPWVLSRDQLISIALNMGNASNRAKLAGGYGWNEQAVMDVLNENLTEAEWQYVQSIWDTIESLWPQIEAMEKRVNGVAPEKIDAEPITTSAGTLRGGYYPVVYDPRQSIDAELQGQKSRDSLFENNYTRAATSRGFTKERTNVERPIHLSLSVIERHLSEVIHDLTHREAIMQADKFLTSRRIVAAVDETLGPEVRRQFRPWLQHIANEWAYDRAGGAAAEKFLRAMRRNATFVGMAFRASTVFMQAAGFSDSTGVIGAKAMTHGLHVFGRNPKQAIDFVLERSGEVRTRMDTLDRDIREAARRHAGEKQILSAAQRFGYMGIGYMDRLVVVPTWIGAYDKALADGKDEQAAIYEADKAVRVSQGSGAAKDLASVQRGRGTAGEAMKLMTMFYSYASGYYQRLRTLGRDVRKANASDIPNLVARSFFLVIAPALLAELLAGRGPDEDDEEGWAEWAFQKVALSVFNPIPLLRDVLPPAVAAAQDKPTFGYSFTPVAKMGDTFVNLARDAGNVIEGEETKRATRDFLESVGYVTGLVPGQIATSAQFLVDVAYGEQDPETFGDWYSGITSGKVKE